MLWTMTLDVPLTGHGIDMLSHFCRHDDARLIDMDGKEIPQPLDRPTLQALASVVPDDVDLSTAVWVSVRATVDTKCLTEYETFCLRHEAEMVSKATGMSP